MSATIKPLISVAIGHAGVVEPHGGVHRRARPGRTILCACEEAWSPMSLLGQASEIL
jgi:hypothetical protein